MRPCVQWAWCALGLKSSGTGQISQFSSFWVLLEARGPNSVTLSRPMYCNFRQGHQLRAVGSRNYVLLKVRTADCQTCLTKEEHLAKISEFDTEQLESLRTSDGAYTCLSNVRSLAQALWCKISIGSPDHFN